jgi:hypothetical protein
MIKLTYIVSLDIVTTTPIVSLDIVTTTPRVFLRINTVSMPTWEYRKLDPHLWGQSKWEITRKRIFWKIFGNGNYYTFV